MSLAASTATALESAEPAVSPIAEFVAGRLAAIQAHLADRSVARSALATIETLSAGSGEDIQGFADVRASLRALARALKPRTYLEIGTRRGWSLAQVACEAPEARVYSVDAWADGDDAPDQDPGPEAVHAAVCRAAPRFTGRITYIDGNSHDVLPVLFDGCHDPALYEDELPLVRESENRPRRIDLVLVDGDRTAAGLWWNLHDVLPRVALGGAVIAGDIADDAGELHGAVASALRPPRVAMPPDLRPSRLEVWRRIQSVFPEFAFQERGDPCAPHGIAVRTR